MGTLTVDGGLALVDNATLHVDFASAESADFVSVSGILELGHGLSVDLAGLENVGNVCGLRIKVISASGGVRGASGLVDAAFTGDPLPVSVKPALRVVGNDVWLTFSPSGTTLIFR